MHNPVDIKFRNDIQGLRAIAVLAVLVFHYDADLLPGGFVGVDIFLVISGYLISTILLKRKNSGHSFPDILKHFYIGRIKRIAPAYFALLGLVSIAAGVLFIPGDFTYYKESLEQALYFNSNNYFAGFGDYFAPGAEELPLLHTWSLAVEMQFYLIMPFVLLFLPRNWLKWLFPLLILLLTLAAEYQVRIQGGDNQSTYYALYARIPEFLLGGWMAFISGSCRLSGKNAGLATCLGLVLILSAASYITSDSAFPGLLALLPCAGAGLIIHAGQGWTVRFLSLPILVWLGAISYSLYLWHWPVLAFLRYTTGSHHLGLSMSVIYVVLTLGLSCLSYYVVEQAFRGAKMRCASIVGGGALVALLVLIVPASSALNRVLVKPLPTEMQRYADPEDICHGKIVGTCLRGADKQEPDILVLGDSHAAMLNFFFDAVGQKLNTTFRVITASSCVTIPGFDYQRIRKYAQKPCQEQIAVVENYLDSASTIVMAASWSGHLQSKEFQQAFRAFLQTCSEKGQHVVLFSDIPRFKKDPVRAHRFETLHIPSSLPLDQRFFKANETLQQIADQYEHVQYVDLTNIDVFKDAPFYNNTLIYHDEHHLNEIGSRVYGEYAARVLGGAINRDLRIKELRN